MSTAVPAEREAFESAVAMARAVLIEGTPVAAVATYWGTTEWQLAATVVQTLTNAIFDFAKATNAPFEIDAAIGALKTYHDDGGDD